MRNLSIGQNGVIDNDSAARMRSANYRQIGQVAILGVLGGVSHPLVMRGHVYKSQGEGVHKKETRSLIDRIAQSARF